MIVSDLRIIEGNSASRHGKIHWHEWKPKYESMTGPAAPDLILLHPMPHDGRFFSAIAPHLAAGRTVVAPDYPGYGASDPALGAASIQLYAEAMIDVLRTRDTHGAADLFGFHTGCLVATEMSLLFPEEVHYLVQVDVPYFDADKRQELLTNDWATGGFAAAFNYDCEDRYPLVRHNNLVIATESDLRDPSRKAAAAITGSKLLEFPDVRAPALESGAVPVSLATLEFLEV